MVSKRNLGIPLRESIAIAILVAVTHTLTGCGERPKEPTILEARAQPFVVDIPVPDRFDLDRRKSTHTFSSGHREIRHYYIGGKSPQSVSNFYRRKMPELQWELVDKQLQHGVDTLTFQKGHETCEIRIRELPGGLFGHKTQIYVQILSSKQRFAAGADRDEAR